MKQLATTLLLCLLFNFSYAIEGMWIPTLLKKYNIGEMQQMGFRLTADDIYDVNHASMKDAVVLFGSGCTGEIISGDGLLITNHHCGFGQIQKHSSVEHDYLTNGFWAGKRKEELPNPGLSVQILVKMEEVTGAVMKGIGSNLPDEEVRKAIAANIDKLRKEMAVSTGYQVDIKPLFYGNQYFAYVYEVFRDVRLVGAPPVSIGKFGGDTDNWVWPRHTGDFSLFRIYAGKDNKPANYSPDNVPYHPKKFFSISMKGVSQGDFTLVFGYPGTTQEYLPSQAVGLLAEKSDPIRVEIRTAKLKIMEQQMATNAKVRIQLSSKYAGVANAWKKWQGEANGLRRLHAVERKVQEEDLFRQWVNQDATRKSRYGKVLEEFREQYAGFARYQVANDIYSETILRGTDILPLVNRFRQLELAIADTTKSGIQKRVLGTYLPTFLKDWDPKTDGLLLSAMLKMYVEKTDPEFLPDEVKSQKDKLTDPAYTAAIFNKSLFSDSLKIKSLLSKFDRKSVKTLEKDQLYRLASAIAVSYAGKVDPVYQDMNLAIQKTQKTYMAALLEMGSDRRMMADANLTLRVTYGKVEGYEPMDGVYYNFATTLAGVIAKEDPAVADYQVPETLKKLWKARDFGQYANAGGDVPVAFCASNHTTGGNSGSPVINADGELIGVNFDRCWEGTMSDVLFDPDRCRNIALDIRYALFIIDKFAGAGYLLNEMKLAR